VRLAKKAAELDPRSGETWLILGVAHYRAGQLQEAVADFAKATDSRPRDNCMRQLFMAMAHWQLGDKEKGRELYSQAVEWLEKNQPQDVEELRRFRAEAQTILNIKE
jgi:Flp pilus assembly protein TadD